MNDVIKNLGYLFLVVWISKLLYDFFCQQSEIKKLKKLGIKVEKKFIYSYYRLGENEHMNLNKNNDELCSFQLEREENDTDKP